MLFRSEGEAVGLLLALEIVRVNRINQRLIILLDNQAVIRALTLCIHAPSHHLLDQFHKEVAQILDQPQYENLHITVAWTRGHDGNKGNEAADAEARKAAQGDVSPPSKLPKYLRKPLPHSFSALRQAHRAKTCKRIAADFARSPRYRKLTEIDPLVPSSAFCKLMEPLSRKNSSILTQLRLGHIPLNTYLHRIRKAESPLCPYCLEVHETVIHYLIRCPALDKAR